MPVLYPRCTRGYASDFTNHYCDSANETMFGFFNPVSEFMRIAFEAQFGGFIRKVYVPIMQALMGGPTTMVIAEAIVATKVLIGIFTNEFLIFVVTASINLFVAFFEVLFSQIGALIEALFNIISSIPPFNGRRRRSVSKPLLVSRFRLKGFSNSKSY